MNFKILNSFSRMNSTGSYFAIVLLILLSSCLDRVAKEKINGVSLVASREAISISDIKPILNVNANTVAVMPFAFMENLQSPDLKFNMDRQWWGERLEGVRETVQLLHKDSLEVMLKPQIWIWRGEFTGDIKMNSEADWKKFEENYRDFIILYAQLAEEEKVGILAIGTELFEFVNERPDFWRELIPEIRKFYKGKLTYSENWDKADRVPFWKELDFIGVNAYFPLTEESSPNLQQLKDGWKIHKAGLANLSKTSGRQVLFTEYGYRNINFAAKTPWDSSRELKGINNELQANALTAIYEEFWEENWFAGGFLWKWYQDHDQSGGIENNQFTPQNKPAEKVVRDFYGSLILN